MEEVLDAVIAELNIIKDLPYDEVGFLDEIDLVDDIWFDDPRILAEDQYPMMYVEPVTTNKVGETTKDIEREETVRIGLVVDPRNYYSTDETSEQPASREMIRTMGSIRRHFERTRLRIGGGLAENTTSVEVGSTDYPQQLRGDLYVRTAQLTLRVRVKYPRLP